MRIRFFPFLLVILSLLLGCNLFKKTSAEVGNPYPTNLKGMAILHINDVYEIGPLEGGAVGGMARVATQFKALQKEYFHSHLMLAGDFLSPSVMGTVRLGENNAKVNGAQMVDIMNKTGVTHVCFGNHEFDLDEEDLQKRLDESQFTWIAGNIVQNGASGRKSFQRKGTNLPYCQVLYVSDEKKAWTVGVLSVCLDANQKDFVHYEDIYTSAADQYQLLKEQYKADFVIALTHLNIEEDRELARRLPELKLIMGGHEHENHYETVGEVPIAKADANAKSAYIHRFDFDGETGKLSVKSELIPMDESIVQDPRIEQEVQQWEDTIFSAFRAQGIDPSADVCTLTTPLDGLETHIRTRQTNLGLAIAKAMFACYEGADAAVFNGGSVRLDDKLEGKITQYDILRTLPFGGSIWKVSMKGELLQQVLDAGIQNQGSGGYLQWYRISQEGTDWKINGESLVPAKDYTVVTSSFLMSGREDNLDFLTEGAPGIGAIEKPTASSPAKDIRIALTTSLEKGCN
ncbi:MAG: bifunctional metallophosphatase/5'-nucleotidase [Bacteroidota bacterium]